MRSDSPHRRQRRPRVEILSFEGCPHREAARELVLRIAGDLGVDPEVTLVDVPDAAAAARLRFLGSPTIRVDGRDVEPGAEERGALQHACRVYRTAEGFRGQPDARWVREAIRGAARAD